MKKTIEIFGWYGMIAIVLAYALVSFSLLQSNGLAYQLLNFTGAIGIVVVSLSLNKLISQVCLILFGQLLLLILLTHLKLFFFHSE